MSDLIKSGANALVKQDFNEDQVQLIKRTIAKEATDDELKLFLHQCKKTGLDPLAKQIYFTKHKDHKTGQSRVTIITSIDGYRLIAERSGCYAGNDDPVFDDEKNPSKATVTVYKMLEGIRCAFTASARWEQYYPGEKKGFMWNKMPHVMLGKVAEGLALRKAFPAELSGVYTNDEMEQADKPVITIQSPSDRPIAEVVEKLMTAFNAIGVSLDELEDVSGKKSADWNIEDIAELRLYYKEKKESDGAI